MATLLDKLADKKNWTYNDYLELNDDKRYEIIKGELYMVPAPAFDHQFISANLEFLMRRFIEEKELGYLVHAPTDVILDEENIVQPDILFIFKENRGIIKRRGVFGPPDLAVEIVSPSSQYRDIYEKKDLYERFKVKEFWSVNPYMKSIEVLALDDRGIYQLFSEGYLEEDMKGAVKSKILDGLEVELKDVFKESF